MRTTLGPGSWGIEWKALAFYGTGIGSVGKECGKGVTSEGEEAIGQGCFWKLVGEGK